MGYTYYNPLKVWLDPASIADVVSYMQKYLSENPIKDTEEINQIISDYIAAHPELVSGVDSVNGRSGEVVLTASDINTSGTTTIQEVLTSLSSQISDITQTVTGLDTRISANTTGITNEATARANADTALDNRITALQGAVGSPLLAATAAAMTDTSKIYVYTGSETGYTNGNWYYYNGSAWVSGGVYNAVAINTDTTLTVAGMAADAKATGDELNDLKSNLYILSTNADAWTQGTISAATGANAASTTRIRTTRLGSEVLGVIINSGYTALIYAYSGETYIGNWNGESFIKATSGNVWFNDSIIFSQINRNYEYRIAVKKITDETINVNDYTNIQFITFTDKTLSLPGKAADAEETGIRINRIPHYMAYCNNTTDLVWINAEAGERVLVKTVDGSTFAGGNLNIYDNAGEYKNYIALTSNYGSFRTFVIGSDWAYIKPTVEQNLVIINLSKFDPISNNLVVSNVTKVKNEVDRKSAQENSDFNFIYFSDIHNSEANGNRIFEYAKTIEADCIVNGGDTVLTVIADDITWYNTLVSNSGIDTLTCVGNHDAWTNQSTQALASQTDIYSKFIAPMVSAVSDIIQPTGAAANGLCYYYKDFGAIRVIVLQAMESIGWNSEQGTWLQSVLSDANTNNKYVICVNHAPYQKVYAEIDMDIPLNSFIDYRTGNFDIIHLPQDAVSAVDTFKQAGGKFVCWLSGHTHGDYIMHNSAYTGQLMISIATAKYSRHFDGFCPKETETWSDNFDCFDQIGIDTTHNIIKVLRVGYHEDAGMRIRNRFAYDFLNNELVSYS